MTDAPGYSGRREPALRADAIAANDGGGPPHLPPSPRRGGWLALALAFALALVAAVLWWRSQPPPAPSSAAAPPAPQAAAVAPPPPPIRYPLEREGAPATAPAPLPALADSDAPLLDRLSALAGGPDLGRLLLTPNVVRRFVATVDNLPRPLVAAQVMSIRPAEGAFAVDADADSGRSAIGAANAARYAPYLAALKAADTAQLAALYTQYYPLFQAAYRDLGYPDGYFNDRMVDVIDHLLATPVPAAPLAVLQPRVLYEFANPDLEARSAGQKALLRMGPENERLVKAKLREFRGAITRASRP